MKTLSTLMLVGALFALLGALYLHSFGVPLESACHMGDAQACSALASAMRTSAWMGGGALVLAIGGIVLRLRSSSTTSRPS